MKVVFQINATANSGSTGRIAENIGNLAIIEGWTSYIAYGRWACNSESELIRIGAKKDVWLHVLQTRLFDRHGLASAKATLVLVECIKQINPDIIHLHNIHGYYVNYEILFEFLSQTEIPVVWTLHDCWAFTGHCAYFTYSGCNSWQTGCVNCPQKRTYPSSLFFDRSKANYADKRFSFNKLNKKNIYLVPVSHWLESELKQSFLKSYPMRVIHNGVDLNIFKPMLKVDKHRYSIGGKFVILGVANVWAKRKGLQDFIELSQKILNDSIIILVGISEKQKKRLPDNVIGISRTENLNQLVELYSLADVFVNPTWEDNYPTTNMEALACGTPVVTYDTGGSPESVVSDIGFVVDQGDMDGLLLAIDIIKNKGRNSYQRSCREYALKYFDCEKQYKEYIHLYISLLDGKKT